MTDRTPASADADSGPFGRFDDGDVRALITEYPLAWVTAQNDGAVASLLPLIGVYDAAGRLTELIGHLARSNPLYAALCAAPQAALLFRGPEAYISPEHAGLSDWAPTWNYAQLVIPAEIRFDADQTEAALNVLIDAMEHGHAAPWTTAQMGPRYHGMLGAIIGFRAKVTDVQGKFKLAQDERPDVLRALLANHPDPAICRWIRRFNATRL
ncbi:FMN-binding negative transcriptional regulator [Sphingomonas hylomeconis]|uniref:FMN-binding negative transcriptional regulator n=1 Tax=Sphingomonas hylomeconis TaxID=1395958 RepID=A0ABV7SZS5_9SPHN|nr:FMN-binding negative transcriptional regulator [Sphingomonas hylomeconis]